MRILVTNDDGIGAPGLKVAEAIAAELAGPSGAVFVVAPAFEQSGVAHMVSYVRPMRIERLEDRRFAVEGSPADCVLAGLYEVMKDARPDLVISGVNRGHNVAEDTVYSGTVGGAMEAALHGVRAAALSQYYGPPGEDRADPFDAARTHGAEPAEAPARRRRMAAVALRRLLQPQLPGAAGAGGARACAPPTRGIAPRRPSACCATSRRTAGPSSG